MPPSYVVGGFTFTYVGCVVSLVIVLILFGGMGGRGGCLDCIVGLYSVRLEDEVFEVGKYIMVFDEVS